MDAEEWREEREKQRAGREEMRAVHEVEVKPIAEVVARALRLKQYAKLSPLDGAAKCYGRMVLSGLSGAGVSDEELGAAKERMVRWMRYLREYDADMRAIDANEALDEPGRRLLMATMAASREQVREDIFG